MSRKPRNPGIFVIISERSKKQGQQRYQEPRRPLLKQAGSKERRYGIYGGNDGRVMLLTEEMYGLLHVPDLKIDLRWLPYPPDAIRRDGSPEFCPALATSPGAS
jgi:hypothetical protein